MLKSAPVSVAPNFGCPFKLAVDTSDVAAGAVLLQGDGVGLDHPVCYYAKKFNKCQQNYSTVEKECLALKLALQHFQVYVGSGSPVTVSRTACKVRLSLIFLGPEFWGISKHLKKPTHRN